MASLPRVNTLPRVNIDACDAELRRRMAAAEPAAQMALLHMAAGAADHAHSAIDYGLACVAGIIEGTTADRLLDPVQELTRPGGIDARTANFLEAAGVVTVRDLVQAGPDVLREVFHAGPGNYEAAMIAAAKYLGGVI
jgi:hypothetical protein